MRNILIKFKITIQVGPDDYERITREKMFTENATLKEVSEWMVKNDGYIRTQGDYKRIDEGIITEPE